MKDNESDAVGCGQTKPARPLRAAGGAMVVAILPMLALLVARGPVDGAGDQGVGYWGKKTASVNWCEADYVVTPYIAEFWNSLSSFFIIMVGLYGIYMHWRAVEPRYMVAFAAFIVVGLGSFAFHSTLWRSMQLLDELPMIWGNSAFIYIMISMEDEKEREPRTVQIWVIAAATALMTVACAALDKDNQDVFLVCYGGGVVFLFARSWYFDAKYNSFGTVVLLETALLFYGGGFFLWLVDRNFCTAVRSLYLHVFWHVFAGLGTFTAMIFWIWVRYEMLGCKPKVCGVTPVTRWVLASEKLV